MSRAIVTFLWPGARAYRPHHANALARMCKKHSPSIRVICVTEGMETRGPYCKDIEVVQLPKSGRDLGIIVTPEGHRFPSSYRRLWALSAEAVALAEQILVLDVDCIVAGPLDSFFERTERFVGWHPGSQWGKAGRFGGGTWLHRTGTLVEKFEWFSKAPKKAITQARLAGYRGSDQAILSFLFYATEAKFTEPSGIYQAQDYTRINGDYHTWKVPPDAKILHFNGTLKPWQSQAGFAQRLYEPFTDRRSVT